MKLLEVFSDNESLDGAFTETFDNNEILKFFKTFSITATKQDSDEFVAIDEESSYVFL